jgi:hypothetical protein
VCREHKGVDGSGGDREDDGGRDMGGVEGVALDVELLEYEKGFKAGYDQAVEDWKRRPEWPETTQEG